MYQPSAETGLGADVNIIEAMEMFKDLSDTQLAQAKRNPSYALFANLEENRRLRMRNKQTQPMPTKTIAEQLSEAAAMPQTMPPQQSGLAALMGQPQQMPPEMTQEMPMGMARGGVIGGPVAFSDGLMVANNVLTEEDRREIERRVKEGGGFAPYSSGVGMEFGGDTDFQGQEPRVPAIIKGQRVMATPNELRAAGYSEATIQERFKQPSPKPVAPSPAAPQPQKPRPLAIPPQPSATPMGLSSIIKTGKDAMKQLGISPIQMDSGPIRADGLYAERQRRFPDETSPIMKRLEEFYGKQPTQEEIQKAANRQIALSMMGTKERNFLTGLASSLQAGEDVKKSMMLENKAAQQSLLQAQLSHAKYQDALRRGDYDAAEKAAREERAYKLQAQQLQQQQAMMPLEIGLTLAKAMQPKGTGGAFSGPQAAKVRETAYKLAAPEIAALEKEYEAAAKPVLGMFGGFETNWRQGEKGKELERRKQEIINKYIVMMAPELGAVTTPSAADLQRYYQRGSK